MGSKSGVAETNGDALSAVAVGQSYFELHHRLHRFVDQSMCAAGVSLTRAKVLMRLAEHGPMNQATLAGLLGFAPRSVTDAVDGLERDGLVDRTEDPNDRRARILALTDAGRAAFDTAMRVRTETFEHVFGALSTTERAKLKALLAKLSTTITSGDAHSGN